MQIAWRQAERSPLTDDERGMNRTGRPGIGVALAIASFALANAAVLSATQPAAAVANGPTITVGAPTLVGDAVHVPVRGMGGGFAPYDGFSIHVRWDPAVFRLGTVEESGGAFDAASSAAICAGPDSTTYDGDGGGFILS